MSNRGRKQLPDVEPIGQTHNPDALAADSAALQELARRSTEVAELYGDGVPYERERVISETRYLMSASAEAMLEAGKRLIQVKENEPHGEFVEIVTGRLKLGERSAQRMMAAAAKYLSPRLASKATALSALGSTKLFDLAFETEDDLEALAKGGTLAGHTLDEIDAMTSRELKAALREAKADKDAKDRLLDKKNREIDQLKSDLEFKLSGDTEAQLDELASTTAMAEVALIRLTQAVGEINGAAGAPLRKKAQQAVQYLVSHLAELIDAYGIDVSLAEGLDTRPDWLAALPPDHASPPAPGEDAPRKPRPAR